MLWRWYRNLSKSGDRHLYERAAKRITDAPAELLPIWHLDADRALFVGPLGHNAPHAHSVPVYLAGVYGAFRLRIADGLWMHRRSAVVPAGVPYEFDVAGQPLAVLYLEPSEGGVDALVPLGADDGALKVLRELYESRDGAGWSGEALDSLIDFSRPRAGRAIDVRISRVVAALARSGDRAISAADAAHDVGLSSSRFQHLFAERLQLRGLAPPDLAKARRRGRAECMPERAGKMRLVGEARRIGRVRKIASRRDRADRGPEPLPHAKTPERYAHFSGFWVSGPRSTPG